MATPVSPEPRLAEPLLQAPPCRSRYRRGALALLLMSLVGLGLDSAAQRTSGVHEHWTPAITAASYLRPVLASPAPLRAFFDGPGHKLSGRAREPMRSATSTQLMPPAAVGRSGWHVEAASRTRSHVTTAATREEVDAARARLLSATAAAGPVGVDATESQQEEVEAAAVALENLAGGGELSSVPLSGTYDLLYSMAKGSSNGKIGPVTGKVVQIVVDDKNFINRVSLLGGALVASLRAQREIIDGKRIKVSFVETVFELFGKEVSRKPTQGQGVWSQLFVEPGADGQSAGLRVMRTPSLFILKQRTEA